jgi:hypothetical protein
VEVASSDQYFSLGLSLCICKIRELCGPTGSQSMVPKPTTSASLAHFFEKCRFTGPIPDILNWNLWSRRPAICVLKNKIR